MLERDVEVARWLRRVGLRLPAVLEVDEVSRRVVLEDLGEEDAEARLRALPDAGRAVVLEALLSPLVVLSAVAPQRLPGWSPPLDARRLRWELAGFELWFVRHRCGVAPPPSLGSWLDDLAREVGSHPRRICHRDYHLNNLFVLPDGEVAVIDAQDVLVGPDTYDAVSLMSERAMLEILPEAERRGWRRLWAERTGAEPGWDHRWRAVRVQRALKVLGTFARLEAAGRSRYGAWAASVAAALLVDRHELDLPQVVTDLLLD